MATKPSIASKLRPTTTLGTVPWIVPYRDGLLGDRLSIVDSVIAMDSMGDYIYTEIPVPSLSSRSRLVWESINQRIMMIMIEGVEDLDSMEELEESDLETKSRLLKAAATNAEDIRALKMEALEIVLRLPEGSTNFICDIINYDGDIFDEAYELISNLIAPKTEPKEEKEGEGKGQAKG